MDDRAGYCDVVGRVLGSSSRHCGAHDLRLSLSVERLRGGVLLMFPVTYHDDTILFLQIWNPWL